MEMRLVCELGGRASERAGGRNTPLRTALSLSFDRAHILFSAPVKGCKNEVCDEGANVWQRVRKRNLKTYSPNLSSKGGAKFVFGKGGASLKTYSPNLSGERDIIVPQRARTRNLKSISPNLAAQGRKFENFSLSLSPILSSAAGGTMTEEKTRARTR